MGTRGLFGFRKNGVDKANYCQWDSYPKGLGHGFITLLKHIIGSENFDGLYDKIICIDPANRPTTEQVKYCNEMGWINLSVSEQSVSDWYCVTRELQDPEKWESPFRMGKEIYIKNSKDFIYDSLFCEYAYIYDFDTKQLEFYVGYQLTPDEENRYGSEPNNGGYYPCKLACVITAEALKAVDTIYLVDYLENNEKSK